MANQRCIKGYYKLRNAELIHKLNTHPDVNDQVLMPGLEKPRKATRSVNTNAFFYEPILDDKTPVLQPT